MLPTASFVSSEAAKNLVASIARNPDAVIYNYRQEGNPVLRMMKNVQRVCQADIAPDFILGQSTCALFISVKYHMLHPNYLYSRIRELGRSYTLRVVICLVDTDDNVRSLGELNKICFTNDLTLLLAWSQEEAARYLETLKVYEKKGTKSIQKRQESEFLPAITKALTDGVRSVNKTDVVTLLDAFDNLKGICNASEQQLLLCPGFGDTKVRALHAALHTSFTKPSGSTKGASRMAHLAALRNTDDQEKEKLT
jgi:DNA excision repair protein ERCC-1